MKALSSRENPRYKALRALAGNAGRRGEATLLEGVHLCQAWLDRGLPVVQAIFDADRLAQPALAALAARVPEAQAVALAPRLLAGLESVETGQGVLFVVQPPAPALPARLADASLWLDRVQDPGNVGTLLRTAAAAGIRRVLLSAGCAAAWSPKVLRSAQGAHVALAIHEQVDLLAARTQLDVPLVVSTLEAAEDLYDAELPAACAWVFGHEGQGVAPALQAVADRRIRIAHDAQAVESLNVAAAAAICLFEQRRRHRQGSAPAVAPAAQ
ncbi:23S rRNA (guanosine-2'-O-) -methyltransferase rlmB [plant metagenome]|uniref:23S rRNA (Guanosine-2'-O-) -methyltransferase rlmB n=1 Tax=plant metagenome TaxID=1297885 RepID=A0A484RE95_9ZZZZ